MKIHLSILTLAILLAPLPVAGSEEGDAILGKWVTDQGRAHIVISKRDDKYSGRIVWLAEPYYAEDEPLPGEPRRDLNNPDSTQHDQPIIGLAVLRDFEYTGRNSWKKGAIYDPETGKTYKSKLTLTRDGSLKVRGFIGISLIGETTVWTRYQEEEEEEEEEEKAAG